MSKSTQEKYLIEEDAKLIKTLMKYIVIGIQTPYYYQRSCTKSICKEKIPEDAGDGE